METFGRQAAEFYTTLRMPRGLPEGVGVLNPYKNKEAKRVTTQFFHTFFDDTNPRVFVIGINPGRFGSGITGIPFTDAATLREHCGIDHALTDRQELTAQFVYRFVEKCGGAKDFYKKFYLTSVSPVGFLNGKINFNYYDDPGLFSACEPFILRTLKKQVGFGASRNAILLGMGKNQKAFERLNEKYHFFDKVFVLPHPRFIAQYKRKHMAEYLEEYGTVFRNALRTS